MERLVLHIEVPEFNVDGTQEAADEWNDGNILPIVTEEWMRDDVIVVANDIPGEKNMNSDFAIHALVGRIIGAEIVREASNQDTEAPYAGQARAAGGT
jgi:hypothetical protein